MKGSILRTVAVAAGSALALTALAIPALAEDNTELEESTPAVEEVTEADSDASEEAVDSEADVEVAEESLETESVAPEAKEAESEEEAEATELDIVAITDFHGYLAQAPNLACQLNNIRDNNPNTLFVSNGDNIGGSAYIPAVAEDKPTIDILNAMGLNFSSAGNHEFDKGYADLSGRVHDLADFPIITANVRGVNPEKTPRYAVIETGGVKVGFVGATPKELPELVSNSGIAGLTLTDPVAAVNEVAADLKDGDASNGEADVVVALMHDDSALVAQVGSDVDAVVGGHSHLTAEKTTASGAPVAQPANYGKKFAHFELSLDSEGNVTEATVKNVDVEATPATVDDKTPMPECVDETILAKFRDAEATAQELGKTEDGAIQGKARHALNEAFTPDSVNFNRGTESSGGNLLAQGFYKFSEANGFGADFGIINPGGVRTHLDFNGDGILTAGEVQTTMPFGNNLGTLDLTPNLIYEMLEQQWKAPDASHPVLMLGLSDSIAYDFNPDAEQGKRIGTVYINGKAIDRNDTATTFTVISNTFLLEGGDSFDALAKGKNFRDLGWKDTAGFNEFLKANPGYKVSNAQRNVGIGARPVVEPGVEAAIALSSLAFTADEEKPAVATLSLEDGTVLGEVALDNTVVPKQPTTGQGTMKFTVPAGTPGGELTVVLTDGDTVYPFTLTVAGEEPGGSGDGNSGTTEQPSVGTTGHGSGTSGSLAKTGVDVASLAFAGALLLMAGASTLIVSRRHI